MLGKKMNCNFFSHYLVYEMIRILDRSGSVQNSITLSSFIRYLSNLTDCSCIFLGSLDSIVVPFFGLNKRIPFMH